MVEGRTADLNGSFKLEEDRLGNENFSRFGAKIFNLVFLELHRLSRSVPANC
jgi:hypothetical protein